MPSQLTDRTFSFVTTIYPEMKNMSDADKYRNSHEQKDIECLIAFYTPLFQHEFYK